MLDLLPPVEEIVVSGGALEANADWLQITADVLERPLALSTEREASARGAAVAVLERLGHDPPAPPVSTVVEPRKERSRGISFSDGGTPTDHARSDVTANDVRKLSIDTIRTLAMDSVQKANAGHPGTAMALAPLAYVLYRHVLRHNPANPEWPNRDRFVLSAGHACILQYAALHLSGYDLSLDELKRFRQWQSRTPGHPEHFLTEGVETTTGPLGQGFANGVGMAITERFLAERYNRPHHTVIDHRIYAICSDGDLMEGVSAEAASIAGHLGLGKLVYVYDDNHITIDGTTALTYTTEDKGKRFEAYGWHVQHVDDSEDVDALEAALLAGAAETERPSLIVVRSHIAYPAPHAQDTAKAHGSPLGEDEVRATKEVLGWDPDEHFVVPDEVVEHIAEVKERGIAAEQEWKRRASSAGAPLSRRSARTGTRRTPAGRVRAGRRRCPSSTPARTWPPGTPARRSCRPSSPTCRR